MIPTNEVQISLSTVEVWMIDGVDSRSMAIVLWIVDIVVSWLMLHFSNSH